MPTPTIPAGNLFMNATLYTGTGSSLTVANGATGQSFQPDLVWIKSRSNAYSNELYDSVRGVQKRIISNLTNAESTSTNGLTAFNSNGFTQGGETETGANGATYVAWNWKAGGAAVTNTAGTISSQVSANTTSGFSVVTYTGTGATATVGHGLGVTPSMVIVKCRANTNSWRVYFAGITANNQSLILNATGAVQTDGTACWSGNTSSVIGLGANTDTNQSSQTFVAYCWSQIAGYSAFGSYTGNGSTDGPFVYTGFRPKFVLQRSSSRVEDWHIHDTSRNTGNVADLDLFPNTSGAEASTNSIDILSNGFKLRSSFSGTNFSGATYIYMAFAEVPFKFANGR